jgi:hypothetical protein
LGGAALATVVSAADQNSDYVNMHHGQLAAERQRMAKLLAEMESLRWQLGFEMRSNMRAACW